MNKSTKIEVFGDTYYLRKTFDIIDTDRNVYGCEVSDDRGNFLRHYDIENIDAVISAILWDIYRVLR